MNPIADQLSFAIPLLAGSAVFAGLLYLIFLYANRQRLSTLDLATLLIKIPKHESQDPKDFLRQINYSEKLFDALASIGKPFIFEVSVHNAGETINFYLAVPRSSLSFAAKQIQGLFLDAQVTEVPDYTIFHAAGIVSAGQVALKANPLLPIRTYRESEVDTFASVISPFSKLREHGDGASVQIVAYPLGNWFRDNAIKSIERLRQGEKTSEVIKTASFVKDLKKAFSSSGSKSTAEDKPEKIIVDEEAVKAIQNKIAHPAFSVNVRVVASADTKSRADEILLSIAGAFSQFSSPLCNSFSFIKPRNLKKLIYQFVFREFDYSSSIILNSEEIASVFHLPATSTDVPRVNWLTSREAPPPAVLSETGVMLGESIFRDDHKAIRLADEDRRRHLYVIGQTGTGKSYFMLNSIVQDMQAGKGLCVIDPHGDLVDKTLSLVPYDRIDDVIVFDPGDTLRPLGLNMLEYNRARPEEKTFIVNELQAIFNRLFDKDTMGPMFERYMRNVLLLLMEASDEVPATLIEVPRVFTDADFRAKLLEKVKTPSVYDFWTKEAPKATGEGGLSNMAPYITSKFDNFISNDYMRPIIGQPMSAFNFRKAMDDGKILLVNLSKGKIGDLNASLLGMIVTGRLLMSALARVDTPESERRDFYLYIDEFQNFTTDSIAVILSEARKYKLNLTIAHQFIAQLTDEIREAVFGNVGSLVSFRIGPNDAEKMVKQFEPTFAEKDLIAVENQHAFAKLLIKGEPSKPFSFKTLPVERGSMEVQDKLKELSRLTYGKDIAEVEREILSRLRS